MKTVAVLSLAFIAAVLTGAPALAEEKSIIVQSTTSTANSGLYAHILPIFENASGIKVHVVAVGTGQAIKNARNCDGDVLFVHAKFAEEQFVADGYGVQRHDVMYNDFVIVGPVHDPAGIDGMDDAVASMRNISKMAALFASRGDDSGTHKKERALWVEAGVNPAAASGGWYRETGSGMGATLNAAVGMGAYTLTDRATWISFGNKGTLDIVVEGDAMLFNQYGITLVNKAKCSNVKAKEGQAFVDWVLSHAGQKAIGAYQREGQALFFPNAKK